jgi:2-ketoarginine methyltransferase
MPALPPDYERRLIANIQPIRYFFLASALHHALQLGIFTTLADKPGMDTAGLAAALSLDERRLIALLRYLENENYLLCEDGWRTTAKGGELLTFAPWYQMLVGGYATTFLQLSDVLRSLVDYATRDTGQVGAGSCGISVTDTLPLTLELLDSSDVEVTTLVDIGCGDGGFLMEILRQRPGLRGVAIDPDPDNVERALALRAMHGLADRLQVVKAGGTALTELELPDGGRGVAFMSAFVLQELLEQDGEQAVFDLLSTTFASYPATCWVVVEMDNQPTSALIGTHGLAQAFYNPYFLIHSITEQRLETAQWWTEFFQRAGLDWVMKTTDPRADSTGLQIGFLLTQGR